ncbi:MAG: hypothetical protein M0Q92_02695 [Methanoregula sp.]|jgi:hypothetical protein|nr:hypothetical protein [Methanoregula sp.]
MALYGPKIPETFEATKYPDGSYVVTRDGKPVIIPGPEFEAKYVPFVQQG